MSDQTEAEWLEPREGSREHYEHVHALSAVERVQAAIDKLKALKSASTAGPWLFQKGDRRYVTHMIFGLEPGQEVVGATANKGGLWYAADGELIVTLHATIDPLLATLERWLEYRPLQMEEPIVALADAILGAEVTA